VIAANSLLVASEAFAAGEHLATKHTREGSNVSPPLRWNNMPAGTRSVAVICEDEDAPGGVFTHWVLYDLPEDTRRLSEGSPGGGKEGLNSMQTTGYVGPSPPPDRSHRYVFRVYALDVSSIGPAGLSRDQARAAMDGHVLAEGSLMARYQRRRKVLTGV
jgi:Raf kinase inhibitor-like YbhB/YbcL family protein